MVKGSGLRAWQSEAIRLFFDQKRRTFLTTATPGAGKTVYALTVARQLQERGLIGRVYVVCPTDHLRTQWVEAAARAGFDLRPTPNGERVPRDADGAVVTYAQVALQPRVHEARVKAVPTMVILDEVHHAGDSLTWGSAVMDAFEPAFIRFPLTGTPFRSDTAKIAHVTYQPDGEGGEVSVADYTYGYSEALRDGVVRPVVFATYSGHATWITSANQVQQATLGDPTLTREAEELAWRTALDPAGEWIPHVLAAAWGRVSDYRRGSIPDAKVLIPASNQDLARAYADVWRRVTGNNPVLVLSDDTESAARLAEFRDNPDRVCCVCVRMVTEGVDVPAAAVLVWSTTASTPMFFRQMVGRVIRARNRRERATVFLPAVRRLVALAADMERERDHVIGPSEGDADTVEVVGGPAAGLPNGDDDEDEDVPRWRPVQALAAFEDVIGTGTEDLFGIDGLLTPAQEAALLQRQDQQNREAARRAVKDAAAAKAKADEEHRIALITGQIKPAPSRAGSRRKDSAGTPGGVEAARLRSDIAAAVRARAGATGALVPQVWQELYRLTPGPKNAQATLALLEKRRDLTLRW